MAGIRRPFEDYAIRVTCVLLASLIAWNILQGKGLVYAFYGFFMARTAVKGVDFAAAQNWWLTFLFLIVLGAVSAFTVYIFRARSLEDRWMPLLLTGCFLAQSTLLLSGRWRGVWSFARSKSVHAWERMGRIQNVRINVA